MALKDFYTNVGDARMKLERNEMVTRVFLPEDSAGWKGSYMKLRIRGSIDYPLAGVAVALEDKNGGPIENARVAITAVNPAPLLVKGAESALVGKQIDEHVAIAGGRTGGQDGQAADDLGTDAGVSPGDCEGVCEAGGDGGGEILAANYANKHESNHEPREIPLITKHVPGKVEKFFHTVQRFVMVSKQLGSSRAPSLQSRFGISEEVQDKIHAHH